MPLRPRRAVVVDPDPFYRRILGTCLQSLRWETATMESGHELVEVCMRGPEPFDIAILAHQGALIDGLELARTLELFIPVGRILLTGEQPPNNVPEHLRFLKKPVDFSDLIRWLQLRWRDLEPSSPQAA